jgi:hypothetical protein
MPPCRKRSRQNERHPSCLLATKTSDSNIPENTIIRYGGDVGSPVGCIARSPSGSFPKVLKPRSSFQKPFGWVSWKLAEDLIASGKIKIDLEIAGYYHMPASRESLAPFWTRIASDDA